MGMNREESLMMIGDTMIIPIAPAGKAIQEGHPAGDMFRRSAAPMRWLGLRITSYNVCYTKLLRRNGILADGLDCIFGRYFGDDFHFACW